MTSGFSLIMSRRTSMFTRSGCFLPRPKSMISFCFSCSITSISSSASSAFISSKRRMRSFSSSRRCLNCCNCATERLEGSFSFSSISSKFMAAVSSCAAVSLVGPGAAPAPSGAPIGAATPATGAPAAAGIATILGPANNCPTGTPVGITSSELRFTSCQKAYNAPAPSKTYNTIFTMSLIFAQNLSLAISSDNAVARVLLKGCSITSMSVCVSALAAN